MSFRCLMPQHSVFDDIIYIIVRAVYFLNRTLTASTQCAVFITHTQCALRRNYPPGRRDNSSSAYSYRVATSGFILPEQCGTGMSTLPYRHTAPLVGLDIIYIIFYSNKFCQFFRSWIVEYDRIFV